VTKYNKILLIYVFFFTKGNGSDIITQDNFFKFGTEMPTRFAEYFGQFMPCFYGLASAGSFFIW